MAPPRRRRRPPRAVGGGIAAPVRKFPARPLLDQFVTDDVAAERLGVSRRTILRWQAEGIDWTRADELATAVGLHPAFVWGQDWLDAALNDPVPPADLFDPFVEDEE